jgi:ABC-type oligopeptide transport system ATPase subunit
MNTILQVDRIVKIFGRRGSEVRAVDGVSFAIEEGTTFGLVGESGSGKSTVARCALRLIEPTTGDSTIAGTDLAGLSAKRMRPIRAVTGMVFQNPIAALDPRMSIRDSIGEPLRTHTTLGARDRARRVAELLDDVGLASAFADRLPHQLSGGQCQRVGIARALATSPRLLVLDEPTSALDVSVQAQVLNLLQRLKEEHGLSYLLISHDLDVVRYMSDTAGVMRRGELVETGPSTEVLVSPRHEYTQQLLAAMPETPGAPSTRPVWPGSRSRGPGPLLSDSRPDAAPVDLVVDDSTAHPVHENGGHA